MKLSAAIALFATASAVRLMEDTEADLDLVEATLAAEDMEDLGDLTLEDLGEEGAACLLVSTGVTLGEHGVPGELIEEIGEEMIAGAEAGATLSEGIEALRALGEAFEVDEEKQDEVLGDILEKVKGCARLAKALECDCDKDDEGDDEGSEGPKGPRDDKLAQIREDEGDDEGSEGDDEGDDGAACADKLAAEFEALVEDADLDMDDLEKALEHVGDKLEEAGVDGAKIDKLGELLLEGDVETLEAEVSALKDEAKQALAEAAGDIAKEIEKKLGEKAEKYAGFKEDVASELGSLMDGDTASDADVASEEDKE